VVVPMGPLRIVKWVLKIAALAALALFVYLVISVVQVLGASEVPQVPSAVADAASIVVISPPGHTSTLSTDDVNRLEQALSLFTARKAPMVVLTGGTATGAVAADGPPPTTEVGAEVQFLEKQGLKAVSIDQVAGSDDPSSMAALKKLVGHADGGKVIIVADPLSSLRLRATAAGAGLSPEISPATPPASSFWNDVSQVWRQASAVAFGRVFGFGSTGWAST
jgi:uncharacterized SAM-binding protein YcdF (DUF218 family)